MHAVKEYLTQAIRTVSRMLFPRRCIGCGCPIDGNSGGAFCSRCLTQYMQARTCSCPSCGEALALCRCVALGDGNVPLYSLLPYRPAQINDTVSRLLLNRKTRLNPAAEDFLAEQISALCECVIAERGGERADWVLTYPPRSTKKRREVGHDQSEVLTKRLSSLTGIPMIVCLERVSGADTAQKSLGAAERAENAQESYVLSRRFAEDIRGKRVLLIDDIATTGATLSACASILTSAGAAAVIAVTGARTVHERN